MDGILLDVYPAPDGMALWLLDDDGRPHRFVHPYAAAFYMHPDTREGARRARDALARSGLPLRLRTVEGRDLFAGEIPVVEVEVPEPWLFQRAVAAVARIDGITLYNCDIEAGQRYLSDHRLFPLGRCAVESADGVVRALAPLEAAEALEYEPPRLVTLRLRVEGGTLNPAHRRPGRLEVGVNGDARVLDGDRPEDLLHSLNAWLSLYDPDVILTEYGDALVLPALQRLSRLTGVPLNLNRDHDAAVRGRPPRSYLTYGRIVYQPGAQHLHGRLHLDLTNSFTYQEAELDGLVEIARLARVPLQHLARTSTGTAITAMQLDLALQAGILVPWRKAVPETFKDAVELLETDKGGLVYHPIAGAYEQVGELDFASMYPTLMVHRNISPETVNCRCCAHDPAAKVPGVGHHVCQRRAGLVPRVLEGILSRRAYHKRRRAETAGEARRRYDLRQTALKWLLVVSFGYLGYKNARFGRIEAHECTTAYSREMLLRAKEIAEARGFRMLHALVDSLWLHRPGAARDDYAGLAAEIERATGLPLALEGVYRWIVFGPSRTHDGLGVPNRYAGVFEDGTVKVRGIEMRRRDMPPIVVETQRRLFDLLAQESTLDGVRRRLPEARVLVQEVLDRLRARDVTADDLAFRTAITRAPHEYVKPAPQAIAAQQLYGSGVNLHRGEVIAYIIRDAASNVPNDRAIALGLIDGAFEYDVERYCGLVARAAETVLGPLDRRSGERACVAGSEALAG